MVLLLKKIKAISLIRLDSVRDVHVKNTDKLTLNVTIQIVKQAIFHTFTDTIWKVCSIINKSR